MGNCAGYDIGGELNGYSLQQCQDACTADLICAGISFMASDGVCHTKSASCSLDVDADGSCNEAGYCFWRKVDGSTTQPPVSTAAGDEVQWIIQQNTPNECHAACNAGGSMICNAESFATLTSQSAVEAAFSQAGVNCKAFDTNSDGPWYAQASLFGATFSEGIWMYGGTCTYSTDPASYNCKAQADEGYYRLCPCIAGNAVHRAPSPQATPHYAERCTMSPCRAMPIVGGHAKCRMKKPLPSDPLIARYRWKYYATTFIHSQSSG